MLRAFTVARFFIDTQDDAGELITNLKLQKLCYYAQGAILALTDEPLFRERIEAWEHGPVVPALYDRFKQHGSNPIPQLADVDFTAIPKDTLEVLSEIGHVFGQYSGWKLRDMTHDEPPWKEAWAEFERDGSRLIGHDSMKEYCKTLLIGS